MFKLTIFLLTLSYFFSLNRAQTCTRFCVRKEWRRLSTQERANYVRAVAQLRSRRASEYQSFANTHQNLGSRGIHTSAQFLPWHRYFVKLYEDSLRTQVATICMPYWDATLDRGDLAASPVFNATTGFGALSRSCVRFSGISQLTETSGTCVRRASQVVQRIDPTETLNVLVSQTSFATFSRNLEIGYHSNVHVVVGGDENNPGQMSTYRSPADPIFFLHHCFVDRLWSLWQSRNFARRLTDLSYRTNFPNLNNINTNLIGTNTPARNYMDISTLCYRYEDVPVKSGTRTSRRSLERRASPALPPTPNKNPDNSAKTKIKGGQLDLGEVGLLEHLAPLPEFWITMHHYNETYVRQWEKKRNDIIDQLNDLDGYLSPSVVACNSELIKRKLLSKPGVTRVVFSIKGERHELPVQLDYTNTAKKLVELAKTDVRKHYQQLRAPASPPTEGGRALREMPLPSLETQLTAIIGKPVFAGTLTANPFDALNQG